MKVSVFEIYFNADSYIRRVKPYAILEIDEFFKTEKGLWVISIVPLDKIEIISRPGLDNSLKYEIIADIDAADYTYWQLKYA
jgi:hypothetical protein